MRLIDADKITSGKIAKYLGRGYECCTPDIEDMLKEQPTAYDVDKIVKQLEEERDYSYANFEKYAEEYGVDKEGNWHFEGLKRAIEIVKGGGVEK